MAQSQCLLTRAGFAEFILKLADFLFHTRQRFIKLRRFFFQHTNNVGQFLFFNQRGAGQIVFIFTQRQLGFLLPFGLLRVSLLDAARDLFLFRQRAGGG